MLSTIYVFGMVGVRPHLRYAVRVHLTGFGVAGFFTYIHCPVRPQSRSVHALCELISTVCFLEVSWAPSFRRVPSLVGLPFC